MLDGVFQSDHAPVTVLEASNSFHIYDITEIKYSIISELSRNKRKIAYLW